MAPAKRIGRTSRTKNHLANAFGHRPLPQRRLSVEPIFAAKRRCANVRHSLEVDASIRDRDVVQSLTVLADPTDLHTLRMARTTLALTQDETVATQLLLIWALRTE
jgi:hypothetical protein